MKRNTLKSIGAFVTVLFFCCNLAMAQDTLYIFRGGVVVDKQAVSEIDSITFYKNNTGIRTTVADLDGNIYQTVKIGTQTWMSENLKTTKYRNGDAIGSENALAYNNQSVATYGLLYSWYTVSDSRNIAPVGWHVATDAEWLTLQDYVTAHAGSSNTLAKALAAKTNWVTSPNINAVGNNLSINNSSGFSALPGGYSDGNGGFYVIDNYGYWWTATQYDNSTAWRWGMGCNISNVGRNELDKNYCFSVRCVKDTE